ncbi:MAG: MarR family transcriptional regulator [Robiginitomaculum sp.]|nr:MAG: MarR family transcriptional regulator [Robiginitomaculum sp.]
MEKPDETGTVFRVFTEIGIISQLVKTATESALPGKMRMSHFGVLTHFLNRPEEQSPSHLANAFQVTNAAMTNTLGKMQNWGHLTIRGDPKDRRAKLVSMTAKGQSAHAEAVQKIVPLFREMLADVDIMALASIEPVLADLRKLLDAARD